MKCPKKASAEVACAEPRKPCFDSGCLGLRAKPSPHLTRPSPIGYAHTRISRRHHVAEVPLTVLSFMSEMMKCFVMHGIGEVGMMNMPDPRLGPSDAILRTTAALMGTARRMSGSPTRLGEQSTRRSFSLSIASCR